MQASKAGGLRGCLAVMGLKAEEAQEPKHVLGDAGAGIADEAHPAGPRILDSAERVVEGAVDRAEQGVHREVAARRVDHPVVGEGDAGVPSECLDIMTERGDLEMGRYG